MKEVEVTESGLRFRGSFELECFDKGGNLKWREETSNLITNQGLNHALNVELDAATQITTWYCCLVETNTTPALTMTYAVPAYTESTAYTQATRPEYVEAASTAQSTTNSANKAVYTINAIKTMYGASLVGGGSAASTKGDTTGGGTLLCYALFGTARSVISGDTVNLTYTVNASN